jgi:hypothetical protein
MNQPCLVKYGFRIRTRSGVLVDGLSIFGRTEEEALRKLFQMYNDCEVLSCQRQQQSPVALPGHMNYEDVVDLISAA